MASYTYRVEIREPAFSLTDATRGVNRQPDPVVAEFNGARMGEGHIPSARAIEYARRQHGRPDGTTVTIQRQRVVIGRNTGTVYALGNWLLYRRYEVQGGIVRRTDR